MTFEDVPLDALREVLRQTPCEWQKLFVEVGRFAPTDTPLPELFERFLEHHRFSPGWRLRPIFNPARLPAIDRPTAERYLALLVQRELAYNVARLAPGPARHAAALFVAPFGPATTFYPSASVTDDLLSAREQRRSYSHAIYTGLHGSTLEEGLFAVDPAGCIGAFFVGDED